MSRSKRLSAAFALALFGARIGVAFAQPEPEPAEEAEVETLPRLSVIGRFSATRFTRWLASDDLDERLRGVERLGEVGTPSALSTLASHAFERRSQLVGREWLTLARALAPHARDPKAELVLATLLNQSPSKSGPDEAAFVELSRGVAALALAAEGSSSALLVLGRALRTVGAPAAAAADALVAHPPRALEPLLDAAGPPSAELARLLGVLGDQRAFHTLRDWVRSGRPDVRAPAAIALTRLGHLETVPLAALWLERGPGELRAAALEILLLAQDERALAPLRARLDERRPDAWERRSLLDYPSPALGPSLLAALDTPEAEAFHWTLLGRVGGEAAARRLGRGLTDESFALVVAHALSRAPGPFAHRALQEAIDGDVRPISLRAAAARARMAGERFAGLDERAEAWLASSDGPERAAAAWVQSLSGGRGARRELASGDEVRVLAATSHALVFDDETVDACARSLSSAPPGPLRTAFAACLVAPRARSAVSLPLLWSLVAEGGAARPLALRALVSRSDPEVEVGLTSHLDHPDALLREHAARGLGENAHASAVGLLVRRLAFETDEGVRRALVTALAAQRGRVASVWLERAARLDPSPRVRSTARLGLSGVPLADPSRGDELLWTALRRSLPAGPDEPSSGPYSSHSGTPSATNRATHSATNRALVSVAPGLAMPVFSDPEGVIVVSGLPSSHLGIRLQ